MEPPPLISRSVVFQSLAIYVLTTSVVVLGAHFGHALITCEDEPPHTFIDSLMRFDSQHYAAIATNGYSYSPNSRSEVAFFPVFPLAARSVHYAFGLPMPWALLLTAHTSLATAFVLLALYVRQRVASTSDSHPNTNGDLAGYALLTFGVLPPTFFFRMAYSEGTFLCLAILAMLGMLRGWRPIVIAAIVGLTTATRPVGVALLLPFAMHVRNCSTSRRECLMRSLFLAPIAAWGLLTYMLYQQIQFGDALAFAKTQAHWSVRPQMNFLDKAISLISGEPLWSVYDAGSPLCWRWRGQESPLLSVHFINPIYFGLVSSLIVLGAWRRWLAPNEVILAAGLLAIPYATRAYEWGMGSHARFAVVVFPAYIVLARILVHLPPALVAAMACAAAFQMGMYSAMFAAGETFF